MACLLGTDYKGRNDFLPVSLDIFRPPITLWRHQMETFSALLAICAGNSPVPGEFPTQRPVTRSFGVFFDLRLNERSSKQSWGWWLDKLSCPLWRHDSKWPTKSRTQRKHSGLRLEISGTDGYTSKRNIFRVSVSPEWWGHGWNVFVAQTVNHAKFGIFFYPKQLFD